MICPNCGAACSPASSPRFCNQCGARLAPPAPPQQNTAEKAPGNAPLSTGGVSGNAGQNRFAENAPYAAASAPVAPTKKTTAAPAGKKGLRMVFIICAAALALAAAAILIVSIVSKNKGATPPADGEANNRVSRAVNPMQLVNGVRSLLDTASCDFDLLTDNGTVRVTGTVQRAKDLMDSCAIVRLPDADGKEAYAYLHEGRLMLVKGRDYITGLNIKGVAQMLENKGGSTLDAVMNFFKIETTDLTYEDCEVLFGAAVEAVKALKADTDEKERLNNLFSIAMEAAIPLLKLRDAKEVADANKEAAVRLLEAYIKNGVSAEALRLTGAEENGKTVAVLTLTPAVFFKEFVAFLAESEDFAAICANLSATPADVLAPYTDEAISNAFGSNQAVLKIGMDDTTITSLSLDYGGNQVFALTLSNHNAAAVDTVAFEYIEDMRSDPNVENNYIDNVLDFLKQMF